jgi:competence protein ComEA
MKAYFTFSKSQKIGVVSIAIIILIQIIILNTNNAVGIPDPFVLDKSKYLFDEDSYGYQSKNKKKETQIYHDFDPNFFSVKEWVSFGFSEKQAKIIIRYKKKIGDFKKKEDLQNVYVISQYKYKDLEPFIKIKKTNGNSKKGSEVDEVLLEKALVKIELNSANVVDLTKIKGVGEYTAKGIIKYKNRIGGYHSAIQLNEVYGVSTENYELILPQIEINASQIIKLNVNKLSISELKNHPYISWDTAKAIIEERFKGALINLNFLVENEILSSSELTLLLPYIQF